MIADRSRTGQAHSLGHAIFGGTMKVGIPAEVKNHEYRVAITPAGVRELVLNGHEVFIQAGAGLGSSITDAEYQAAGAQALPPADDVWATRDLGPKGKEPIARE